MIRSHSRRCRRRARAAPRRSRSRGSRSRTAPRGGTRPARCRRRRAASSGGARQHEQQRAPVLGARRRRSMAQLADQALVQQGRQLGDRRRRRRRRPSPSIIRPSGKHAERERRRDREAPGRRRHSRQCRLDGRVRARIQRHRPRGGLAGAREIGEQRADGRSTSGSGLRAGASAAQCDGRRDDEPAYRTRRVSPPAACRSFASSGFRIAPAAILRVHAFRRRHRPQARRPRAVARRRSTRSSRGVTRRHRARLPGVGAADGHRAAAA